MANIKYKVCVLTVTYANRGQFLNQVLKRVLGLAQVARVVVVNNASVYNVSSQVAQLTDDRIIVLNNEENVGSAGGYKQAIDYAYKNIDADFIWLLDDDNVPGESALQGLLHMWDEITGEDNKKALFCLRPDRAVHLRIAKGEDPYRYYLVKDNFMGFSISRIFLNQYYKLRDKRRDQRELKKYVQMPYVPYGGLLFHKSMVDVIGLPNEDFFVYVDDSEYTYRITQNGGAIWLVPSCRISDVDQSQGIGYKSKPFHSHLLDEWSFRTYYSVRNRMYFYTRVAVSNKLMFKINKGLYLGYLFIVSLSTSKTQQYKMLVSAVNDGINGKLGKANAEKFQ
ncbi:glycosyltransferase [Mucilaginibacter dorajii]|uniref:Glycosyltransferase n=1 Tax=Mucilaginibacter dorajii TaxID=692994 RepID=A0ABP7R4U5_9SPHI|nr:glycosyltransferase [Mucilaginibacter dorajii]MCS3737887.1 GT2 family glycosyltransferase [Mucilaginibacter dorajii]